MFRKNKRTCDECGFLTIHNQELTRADRFGLLSITQNSSDASLPANPEYTRCYKGLWNSDLDSSIDNASLHEELTLDRNKCRYFAEYEPNFNPTQHQERQDEKRKERLQLKIAWLGFTGGLLGSIVGQMLWFLFSRFVARYK